MAESKVRRNREATKTASHLQYKKVKELTGQYKKAYHPTMIDESENHIINIEDKFRTSTNKNYLDEIRNPLQKIKTSRASRPDLVAIEYLKLINDDNYMDYSTPYVYNTRSIPSERRSKDCQRTTH